MTLLDATESSGPGRPQIETQSAWAGKLIQAGHAVGFRDGLDLRQCRARAFRARSMDGFSEVYWRTARRPLTVVFPVVA
jgi:hypothetical protein